MNTYTDAQQHFRSNRKHHRIRPELPCEVGRPGGELFAAKVLDISIGGLKFSCSQETVNDIIPDGERTVGLIMDVEIDVQFTIPSDNKRASAIKTGARIIHSERLAQDLFHVGIQFNTLNSTARSQLEAFIEGLER
ncbi:MAG: PilZ domain-containing protein [Gammaproteobacteria bacterium]